jgi:Icc-related predicted phosphoesterase
MKYFLTFLFVFVVLGAFAQEKLVITHGPYLQHLGENGVTIIWTTNKNAVSWVELAPDDNTHFYLKERPKYFSAEYGFKDVSTLHIIRLSNLTPGTTYRYRVYSQEVLSHQGTKVQYGTVAATNVYSAKPLKFTTVDSAKEMDISFVMVNDIHGRSDLLENLLIKGDHTTADFIFFNGDMVSDMQSEEQLFSGFMDKAVDLFAKEKPMYYARGNHETRGNFANTFPKYFASPSGKLYYLLRRGPVCFVVLDCGEDKPDSDMEYSGIVAFDQYRDAERDWLREAIKSPEFIDAPFKVAIVHMPPFGGWHGEDEVWSKFVPLLNEAKIDVMLCGHMHKHMNQQSGNGINFPVLVNSNNAVVRAEATSTLLDLKVISEKGEQVDQIQLKK